MLIYIAGPISSDLDGYRAKFAAAAKRLRAEGHIVINPAENPDQPSWGRYMRKAIGQLVTCEAAAFLPHWEQSRGARREHSIACDLDMPIIYL
jgi:hypothetical protein